MVGTADGEFSPNMPLTRAMLVNILYREAGSPRGYSGTFTDIAPGRWYTNAVNWASTHDLVFGVGENRFAPNQPISRQDFATILVRYARWAGIDLPQSRPATVFNDSSNIAGYAENAVRALYQARVVSGFPGGMFNPRGNTTRAESAVMLRNFLNL